MRGSKAAAKGVHALAHLAPLCLHFDINETILLGDPAGGDSYEDSLNKILAKVAFVKPVPPAEQKPHGRWREWAWHDGSPLDPELRTGDMPVPPLLPDSSFAEVGGCEKFYNVHTLKKAFAKSFTAEGSPGSIYRSEYDRLAASVKWPANVPLDRRLASEEGYHVLLPSFFHTLAFLRDSGRPFSVVLRTFGTDLPRVREAVNAFAEGAHPDYAGVLFPELKLPAERMWLGRYRGSDGSFCLFPYGEGPGSAPGGGAAGLGDEESMVSELQGELEALPRVSGVMDHYDWWNGHGYSPSAGKPLWLTLEQAQTPGDWRHIFFDDNIHNNAEDSIVAVRARRRVGDPFSPLSGARTTLLHGSVLRKVPTIEAVNHKDWFLQQIEACEARLEALVKDAAPGGGGEVGTGGTLRQILGL
jgi:hypothetical protein